MIGFVCFLLFDLPLDGFWCSISQLLIVEYRLFGASDCFCFLESLLFWLVKNCGSFSFCETLYLMDQNFGVLSIFGSLGSYIIAALISKRNFITKISNKFKSVNLFVVGCLLNSLEAAHVLLVMLALDCLL